MKKLVLLLALLFLCSCAGGNEVLVSTQTTKTVAEDVLFYARVAQNMGKISEAQFNDVKKAYEIVRVSQNQLIDARIAYLKLPSDATADQKYQLALQQTLTAMQNLTLMAYSLGIVKDGGQPVNVPIRR